MYRPRDQFLACAGLPFHENRRLYFGQLSNPVVDVLHQCALPEQVLKLPFFIKSLS